MTDEPNRDPFLDILAGLEGDAKFNELREALMVNYVFMQCFNNDPYRTAFNEGMREMAAMVCGVNNEVKQWLEKKTTKDG